MIRFWGIAQITLPCSPRFIRPKPKTQSPNLPVPCARHACCYIRFHCRVRLEFVRDGTLAAVGGTRVPTTHKLNGHSAAQIVENKTVVVAGGAGFLGSHLCEQLLALGHNVICVDNFATSDRENIAHLTRRRSFQLMTRDIVSLKPEHAAAAGKIFNLACPASPVRDQTSPLDTLNTSVRGMDNLLSIARKTGARVFQASTSEVYGHPSVHPQKESYWGYVNPMGPRACYDEGKRCAETLCFIYREEFGVPVRVARIFNTYGPRMHPSDGRVVVNFIVQALRNEPITVYGDGTQTRSFCYVDDLIDAILKMMSDENECAGPINLGNPAEVTVLELAKHIVDLTASRSRIVLRPLPTDDPPRRRPDIAVAQRALGWKPRTDLATGLARTIAYFESELKRGKYSSRAESGKHRARQVPMAGADVA